MGVPVLALFRENKIRESQYCCHSRNLKSLEIYALYSSYYHNVVKLMAIVQEALSAGSLPCCIMLP